MTDHSTTDDATDSSDDREAAEVSARRGVSEAVACTEAYEQDGQVVLYDAENPLAWIEAGESVPIREMA